MNSAKNIGEAESFRSRLVDNGRGVWLEAVNFPVFPDIPDGLSTRGGKLGKVGNVPLVNARTRTDNPAVTTEERPELGGSANERGSDHQGSIRYRD